MTSRSRYWEGQALTYDEWIDALGSRRKTLLPFAAANRKQERRIQPPRIWHVERRYRQWDGPIGPWAEHFGKGRGQVYSLDGKEPIRSCNEVEVAKLLEAVRFEAFWISSYNPSAIPELWRSWVLAPAEMPNWLKDLDSRIRQRLRVRAVVSPTSLPGTLADHTKALSSSNVKAQRKTSKRAKRTG